MKRPFPRYGKLLARAGLYGGWANCKFGAIAPNKEPIALVKICPIEFTANIPLPFWYIKGKIPQKIGAAWIKFKFSLICFNENQ